ncbi:unnamed protein product [Closterium sp. Naga37s-1]|nr:unnamed protein product [Closterium sp. Naga37s-1]
MANIQSTSSARHVLTFAVLYSASIWAVILPLPRLAEAVALSDVLAQIRDQAQFPSSDLSAGMVEFSAGYDKVTDISSVSLLLPSNDAWSQALSGYQGMNPSATTASDPLYEALDTMVKSKGAVASLNAMSANAKNAMSRLAKYMAIREYISVQDMESGKVSSAVFPANMGSLTSYDAVSPYGKGAGTFALYGSSMALVLSMIAALLL